MKKIWKKVVSLVAGFAILIGCGFMVSACGKDESSKIMNLSVNPSIELILDAKDKVVSVNATNDEGNFIAANASFEGLSAEDAVDLFLKTAKENGFISAETTADGMTIEISGEKAEELFNKVKKSANDYLSSININLEVKMGNVISKEDLQALVANCMQEYGINDLKDKTEEQLIEYLKESREETKDLFSQELKEFYYQSRAEEIMLSKFAAIKEQLESSESVAVQLIATQFETQYNALVTALNNFKTQYLNSFLNEESAYQQAMQDYISAKQELLETRLAGNETLIAQKEAIVNTMKTALDSAKSAAELAMNTFNTAIDTAIAGLNTALETMENVFNVNMETVNTKIKEKKEGFKASFKQEFDNHVNNKHWDGLRPEKNEA